MSAPISPALDNIIRQVGGPASVEYRHLRQVIEQSPVLATQLNQAVTEGHLKHFAFLPEAASNNSQTPDKNSVGALYDPRSQTILLNREHIIQGKHHNNLTFILGHEAQHGPNHQAVAQADARFLADTRSILRSGLKEHNYTDAVDRSMQALRKDEATAHIAGWNAYVSKMKTIDANMTLKTLFNESSYAKHFIAEDRSTRPYRYAMHPGLTLETDLSIKATPANIEAAAKQYFDINPDDAKLGHHHNSDYRNYYATWHVGTLCHYERLDNPHAGKLTLDMERLGLSERLLEQNGINLGGEGQRCAYYTPQAIHTERYFDHTSSTHAYRPIVPEPPDILTPQTGQDTPTPEVTAKALTERQQQWADAIEQFAGAKLREMGLSDTQIENVTAAGIKDMQLRFADKDIQFVGINPYKGGILVIGTGPNFDFPNVSIDEAKDKPAQETLQEMEREQQRQQNRGGPDEPEKGGPGR